MTKHLNYIVFQVLKESFISTSMVILPQAPSGIQSYGDPIVSPAYDLDGNPSSFSNAELDRIQDIWKLVAEDYAPFDVDVTTEDPGQNAIARSSSSDEHYGTRVVMTVDDFASCGCGGFAFVSVFDNVGSYYKPAFVFNKRSSRCCRSGLPRSRT